MQHTILLVAKDAMFLTTHEEKFRICGAEVYCAKPQDIRAAFSVMNYSLVVVKLTPEGTDELNAISWIQMHKGVPIVALSYAPSKDEEILALNRGTDQYWGIPIDNDILSAHLRSLLRRYESDRVHFKNNPTVVAFECGLAVNISIGIAFWKGQRINLRPAPLSLLVILASHVGEPVKKELLYDRVWSGSYDINADEVLKHHISQLRKKLRELGADDLIKTVWGIGYMLRNETLLE